MNYTLPPALRHPVYLKYWLGTLASVNGFQMVQASLFWLVYRLEDSPIFLGYLGLVSATPAILLNIFGGVVADKIDKPRLIFVTQAVQAVLIFLVATLTLLDIVRLWHVLGVAFVIGAVGAFDEPARQALFPSLIPRRAMMSAVALNTAVWQGTRISGPAIAGIIIAVAGTAVSFYVAGVGFIVMLVVLLGIKVPGNTRETTKSAVQDILEGVRFIGNNSIFGFVIGMTFFNSFFGMSHMVVMPVFAEDVLGRGANAYGMLLSAGGLGSLATTLWLGSSDHHRHLGVLFIGGSAIFGIALGAFGLTSELVGSYAISLALLFVSGIFGAAYMISGQSSLQMMVPNDIRGRVMGFYAMTWSIRPLGGMYMGAVAAFIGAPIAVAIGGGAVGLFALGPALVNRGVRNLSQSMSQLEEQV